jgi:hypothetical protein
MSSEIELSDEDIAFLLTILRNASRPTTTQDLIDVLRNRLATQGDSNPAS